MQTSIQSWVTQQHLARNESLMINLIYFSVSNFIQQFRVQDINLLRVIYENRNPLFDSFFIVITNSAAAIAFGIPGILFIVGLINKNKKLWHNSLAILIPVGISALLANILKFSLDVPRPYEIYPFIVKLSAGGSPSFPSGHTADAFAFAIAVGLIYTRWYIAFPVIIWASLVGLSRMWLGVHFPSDVAAGALLGAICAILYIWIDKRNRPNKIAPSDN